MVLETIQWAVGKLKKGADVISGRGIWPLGLIWDKISARTPAPFNYFFSGYRWIQLLSYMTKYDAGHDIKRQDSSLWNSK